MSTSGLQVHSSWRKRAQVFDVPRARISQVNAVFMHLEIPKEMQALTGRPLRAHQAGVSSTANWELPHHFAGLKRQRGLVRGLNEMSLILRQTKVQASDGELCPGHLALECRAQPSSHLLSLHISAKASVCE